MGFKRLHLKGNKRVVEKVDEKGTEIKWKEIKRKEQKQPDSKHGAKRIKRRNFEEHQ